MSTATKDKITLRMERIIAAPPERLFELWTVPEELVKWWGPEGFTTPRHAMDVRPGGRWRFNTAYGPVEGEFREVLAPERLVQTFQDHLQTLEFEDVDGQTKLTQTMHFETTEQRDTTMNYGVEAGAEAGFERIDSVLKALAAR